MSVARLSLSLAAAIGLIATLLAAATIWLLVTQPVTVADAVATGEVSPIMRALAGALYEALAGLVKYPLSRSSRSGLLPRDPADAAHSTVSTIFPN